MNLPDPGPSHHPKTKTRTNDLDPSMTNCRRRKIATSIRWTISSNALQEKGYFHLLNAQSDTKPEFSACNHLVSAVAAMEELLTTGINSFRKSDPTQLLASSEGIRGLLAEFRAKKVEADSQGCNVQARQRLFSICSRIRFQRLLLRTLLRKQDHPFPQPLVLKCLLFSGRSPSHWTPFRRNRPVFKLQRTIWQT
jgi:hypothetical protein